MRRIKGIADARRASAVATNDMTAATSFLAGIAGVGFLAALAIADDPGTIAGQARVIDGDTLEIGGQRVRLWGIDAPEAAQTCPDSTGARYACGERASAALMSLIASRAVACSKRDTDSYGRSVAVCKNADGLDLGAEMVRAGWAIDYTRYSGRAYATEQAEALAAHRGIWAGTFERPEDYRRARR